MFLIDMSVHLTNLYSINLIKLNLQKNKKRMQGCLDNFQEQADFEHIQLKEHFHG